MVIALGCHAEVPGSITPMFSFWLNDDELSNLGVGASENDRPIRDLGISNFARFFVACLTKMTQLVFFGSPIRGLKISNYANYS